MFQEAFFRILDFMVFSRFKARYIPLYVLIALCVVMAFPFMLFLILLCVGVELLTMGLPGIGMFDLIYDIMHEK